MSYADRKTEANERAIAAVAVVLLQGAAIVAVINGLAVHIVAKAPQKIIFGEQIKLPPPPPPAVEPKVDPDQKPAVLTAPKPPIEITRVEGPVIFELPPADLPSTNIPTLVGVDRPTQKPGITPRQARPRNGPETWFMTSDYPLRDLREGNQGIVRFSLTIDTDGKVETCTITRSTGFNGLDEATCKLASLRARFDPATDSAGNRVTGTYAGSVRWMIPRD